MLFRRCMSCKLFCILILLFANSILVSSWEELLVFEEMTSPMIHSNVWQNINENTICMSRVTTISEKHNRHEYETQVYSGVRAARSLVFCVMFFGSLVVLFLLALYCLSFFDLRPLITSLISSTFSYVHDFIPVYL